jgi:hypothetical protein
VRTAVLSPARRRRALQVGFALAGLAAVVVADATASAAGRAGPWPSGRQAHAFLVLFGRVVAGWAFGMVFRIQLVRAGGRVRADQQLRWLLGVPAAVIAAWPVFLPGPRGVLLDVAPLAAVLLGLVMALGVSRRR